MAQIVWRPLSGWPQPVTEPRDSGGRFTADLDSTLNLLVREVEMVGGDLAVIELDLSEAELRRDGRPRARARIDFPGVIVSFESRHGPLRYLTDRFEQRWAQDAPGWQSNLRAVALGLEALRKVERYGIATRGEQYVGWGALPPGGVRPMPAMTLDEAARLLAAEAGGQMYDPDRVIADPELRERLYRQAAKRLHPDAGGPEEGWKLLQAAVELLRAQG